QRIMQPTGVVCLGPQALHEILVSVGGMELDKVAETVTAAYDMCGEFLGHEGFPRARRTVNNGLSLAVHGTDPTFERRYTKSCIAGKRSQRVFRLFRCWRCLRSQWRR